MSSDKQEVYRATKSFLNSQRRSGVARKKPGPKSAEYRAQQAIKEGNRNFFRTMIDDDTEATLWRMFITGKAAQLDDCGREVRNPEGLPYMVDIELNTISFNAFKRAIEYKRGLPTIRVEKDENENTFTVNFNVMGTKSSDLEKRVKALNAAIEDKPEGQENL